MTKNTIIRPAELDDVNMLVDLYADCAAWLEDHDMIHWVDSWAAERIAESIKDKTVFISECLDKLMGTVTLHEKPAFYYDGSENQHWDAPNAEALYLTGLAIHPKWHQQGHGKELVKHCEAYAQKLGVKYIRLDAVGMYSKLHDFYSKQGYLSKGIMSARTYKNVLFEKYID